MNTQDIELFQLVAAHGSFAAVARQLDRDPSAVSRSVAGLEAMLGFRLFHRSTRQMRLTEAGALFLERSALAVDELKRAEDEAKALSSEPEGTLRLSASVAFGQAKLVPLLPAFRDAYPKLGLDLLLTDRRVDLVAERVDLAVRLGSQVAGDLMATRLMATRFHVVASPNWVAMNGLPKVPETMSLHDCLRLDLNGFRDAWRFRQAGGKEVAVPVRGNITMSSVLALKEAAVMGLGPTLLANWLVDDALRDGRLVNLFPHHEVAAVGFDTAAWLLYPGRAFVPRKVRLAIDFLKDRLGGK